MLRQLLEIIPFYLLITFLKFMPFEKRVYWGGQLCKIVLPWIRKFRKRVDTNLRFVYPSMSYQKRKEFIYKEINKLDKISCFNPGGAFYAFPNISKTGLSGKEFSDIALEEKGVALVPGTSFGDSAKDFVRVSYANSMENLEKAIYRLSTI